jgi:hypothetical protein
MATYLQRMTLTTGGTLNSDPIGLADDQAQRIITAHRSILGLPPAATPQQVWAAVSRRVFDTLKADTINYERQQALAAVSVSDIVET